MLLDLLHWVAQPASLTARRLGYAGDSVRLASRSRRCRAAWAPHLAAAQDAVRAAMRDLPRRDTVVVLGSGLLDDVPIDDLAATFRRVVLVDAVHPWRGRWRARRFANVSRLVHDLSGTRDLLLGRGETFGPMLPPLCREADLVVSANLLSQLPILPVARLEAAGRLGPFTDPEAFGASSWRPISMPWRGYRRRSASSPTATRPKRTGTGGSWSGSTSSTASIRAGGAGVGLGPGAVRRGGAGPAPGASRRGLPGLAAGGMT